MAITLPRGDWGGLILLDDLNFRWEIFDHPNLHHEAQVTIEILLANHKLDYFVRHDIPGLVLDVYGYTEEPHVVFDFVGRKITFYGAVVLTFSSQDDLDEGLRKLSRKNRSKSILAMKRSIF